jgi:hypothetical protein
VGDLIKGKRSGSVKQFGTKNKSKANQDNLEDLIPNFKESNIGQQFRFDHKDRYQTCQLK